MAWILGMADEVIRAVRRAERISGVRDAGELLILGMGIAGCGTIFEYGEFCDPCAFFVCR